MEKKRVKTTWALIILFMFYIRAHDNIHGLTADTAYF